MITRRHLLNGMGVLGTAGALIPTQLVFGAGRTDARFIVLILRGGLDGLSVAPPVGDPDYRAIRPTLAIPPVGAERGAIDLDGRFGLHPALSALKPWYDAGEMLVIPAVGTGYHSRSHFDGQNVLENGAGAPGGASDGWLNRTLASFDPHGQRLGLAVGHAIPLILQGKTTIRTFAPTRLPEAGTDFLDRVASLYVDDPLFREAYAAARQSASGETGDMARTMKGKGRQAFRDLTTATGKLMAESDGPRIGVVESTGWDTHFQQPARLRSLLGRLSDGLQALRDGLGVAWSRTIILAVTEFGRTAVENGTVGTDHGNGGYAFAFGGAVAGGRVAGRWPGLARGALVEDRDLMPTTDMRALFKAVLQQHLHLSEHEVERRVFPNSRVVKPFAGLIHT